MKFSICRTSDRGEVDEHNPPDPHAKLETLSITRKSLGGLLPTNWNDTGYNHRTEKKGRWYYHFKETDELSWTLEVDSIKDILNLGYEVILRCGEFNEVDGHIEIYDDYRE